MKFTKKYFTGHESNYKDYRQKKYVDLARNIYDFLHLDKKSTILDFGCATGTLIKELKELGITCYGTDISEWAIEFGRKYYGLDGELFSYHKPLLSIPVDYILMLDVLEHCPLMEIEDVLDKCSYNQKLKGIVIRLPVSAIEGDDFVLDISKNDKTHIMIHSKSWWKKLFRKFGFDNYVTIHKKNIYDSEGVLAWLITLN